MNKIKAIRPKHVILVVLSIAVNLACITVTDTLQWPVRLGYLGTVFSSVAAGPFAGVATAVLTAIIRAYFNFNHLSYMGAGIVVALAVGLVYPRRKKKEPYPVVASGVLAGVLAAVFSFPLNMVFYDGYTKNVWGNGLYVYLYDRVSFHAFSAFLGEAFVDVPDLSLSVILATLMMVILTLLKNKMTPAKEKTISAVLLLPFVTASAMLPLSSVLPTAPLRAEAADLKSDYATVAYDTDDGLVSAEINAVAQTPDGYIYAGTYSGLYRYDGNTFSEAGVDERINSVMQLFVDSKGRLWIGTNDSGIGCYDPTTRETVFYDVDNGLSANAIRAITEDSKGNIYVGTVATLCRITPAGAVESIPLDETLSTYSLAAGQDGVISGVTYAGLLYFLRDDTIVYSEENTDESGGYYCVVGTNGRDDYVVGSSGNYVIRLHFDGTTMTTEDRLDTGDLGYFNRFLYEEELKGYFFCCENGIGFMEEGSGRVTNLSTQNFNSAVSDVKIDYQGNIWFASNKQGLLRFSLNPFVDVFAKAGLNADVVNALLFSDGLLYVGMDNGLCVIDKITGKTVKPELSERFAGVRVRHLSKDTKGNIWAATYGPDGLLCIAPDGVVTAYNEKTAATVGGRFRLAMELSDGTIAAASSSGLNFLKDGQLTGSISEAEGLEAQILSMVETESGAIVAGTDGAGVVIIENGAITKHIGEADGLQSLVILRVVPCSQGYLYVTSNAIYFDDDGKIRKLDRFPYSNNYDIYLPGDGTAWISSSAGIYIVNLEDLINNREYNYTLLNRTRGFYTTLTANAANAVDGEDLYLCCTDGVRKISVVDYNSFENDYAIHLSGLQAGDKTIRQTHGIYAIPPTSGRIRFDVSVLNFTLSNPLLHIYLEGTSDSGITCYQNELSPLTFTNLAYGEYKLHVQVLDESSGEVLREETFSIQKEAQMFEKRSFQIYLFTVCLLLALFVVWSFITLFHNLNRMDVLQKEATIDAMTGLLNKSASKNRIGEACKNKKGILLMIDLDSFKLVNDLYGHDMGDKILIRFAELIRSTIRSTDIAGRMGGDEFIAFIQGTDNVSSLEEKTKFINDGIISSAKQFMGEDMSIPLGASIGAVRVPEEGKNFDDLYRKADKALYTVKQNGKHGFAVYQKGAKKTEEEQQQTAVTGVHEVAMILGERNIGHGAYVLDFDRLQGVYRLLYRLAERYEMNVQMVEFTVVPREEGKEITEEIRERFFDLLTGSLRNSDVVCDRGNGKYFVLLTEIATANADVPIKRILKKWKEDQSFKEFTLDYEEAKMTD